MIRIQYIAELEVNNEDIRPELRKLGYQLPEAGERHSPFYGSKYVMVSSKQDISDHLPYWAICTHNSDIELDNLVSVFQVSADDPNTLQERIEELKSIVTEKEND